MTSYRILDLRSGIEHTVDATSPERAAQEALGENLVRSGRPATLVAKAYFQHPDQSVSMVRLYAKVAAHPDTADR